MKLSDVANIRTGLILSRKQDEKNTNFIYKSLNLKCINPLGYVDKNALDVFKTNEKLKGCYITKKDDVVVKLTMPYTAILIDETTENLVVSSNFLIIRCDKEKILASYLYWFLNKENVKHYMFKNATSNMLNAVNSSNYNNLNIDLIPIEKQKIIGNLCLLSLKENKLTLDLQQQKLKYNKILLNQINNKYKGEK